MGQRRALEESDMSHRNSVPRGMSQSPPQNGRRKDGFTRRGFLKGAGVTAVGTVLADSGLTALAEKQAEQGPRMLGPGAVNVSLKINGQDKPLSIEPRTTLADALRD